MTRKSLNIPIDICIYSVKHGYVSKLQTYCYLKSKCDGYVQDLSSIVKDYIKETGHSERTFFNHRKWLLDNGWLIEVKNGVRVIAFKKLVEHLGVEKPKSRGALFHFDYKDFKGFIYASAITYIGQVKKYYDSRTGTKTKGSASVRLKGTFTLPHAYLAKALGVPKSTAQRYRKWAQQYLEVFPELQKFDIAPEQLVEYRKHSDDEAKNLVIKRGYVYEQKSSKLRSAVEIKRRKW